MRYIKFVYDTEYGGTGGEEYDTFPDDTSDEELNQISQELAQQNGESYEYMVTGWDGEDIEDEEERERALEDYWQGVYGNWKEVTEEEYNENC